MKKAFILKPKSTTNNLYSIIINECAKLTVISYTTKLGYNTLYNKRSLGWEQ